MWRSGSHATVCITSVFSGGPVHCVHLPASPPPCHSLCLTDERIECSERAPRINLFTAHVLHQHHHPTRFARCALAVARARPASRTASLALVPVLLSPCSHPRSKPSINEGRQLPFSRAGCSNALTRQAPRCARPLFYRFRFLSCVPGSPATGYGLPSRGAGMPATGHSGTPIVGRVTASDIFCALAGSVAHVL